MGLGPYLFSIMLILSTELFTAPKYLSKIYPVVFSLKEHDLDPALFSISKGMKIHVASAPCGSPRYSESLWVM